MFSWLNTLIFAVCLYSFLKFTRKTLRNRELIFASFSISCLTLCVYFAVENIYVLLGYDISAPSSSTGLIKEWSAIISISFALSALAILIRNAKPAFARFPLTFTALPLLIIVAHPFAVNTIILKYWLIGIYQGGAIIISALMYTVIATYNSRFTIVLLSVLLYTISYCIYWFLPESMEHLLWLWKPFFGVGILLTTYGYDKLEQAYLSFENRSEEAETVAM